MFEGDEDQLEKIAVIEEAMGYSLIPSCHLEKFFMLIGSGASGKSVLLATLLELIGKKMFQRYNPINLTIDFNGVTYLKNL